MINHIGMTAGLAACLLGCSATTTNSGHTSNAGQLTSPQDGAIFENPVRLWADGKPIDTGLLSKAAHAGPEIGDVDDDGDRDLLVGDFPGYIWLFENTGTDHKPVYTARGKLQAGGTDAKTPVY